MCSIWQTNSYQLISRQLTYDNDKQRLHLVWYVYTNTAQICGGTQTVASLRLLSPGAVTDCVALFYLKKVFSHRSSSKVMNLFTDRHHSHPLPFPGGRLSIVLVNLAPKIFTLPLGCQTTRCSGRSTLTPSEATACTAVQASFAAKAVMAFPPATYYLHCALCNSAFTAAMFQ